MNKLITTYNGGMPFTLDDLGFLQKNTMDTFIDVVKTITGNSAINNAVLYGLEFDNSTLELSAGVMIHNDELYSYQGDTVAATYPTDYEVYYIPVYDIDGNKLFNDSTTHDTYKLNTIGIAKTADIDAMSGVEWRESIADLDGYGKWEDITLNDSSLVNFSSLKIRRLVNNKVEIKGEVSVTRLASEQNAQILVGTLDAKYTPTTMVNFCKGYQGGATADAGTTMSMIISNAGTVAVSVPDDILFGTYYLNDTYTL